MNLVICSDLHLGDGSKRDDFIHDSRFVQSLERMGGGLVPIINGDFADLTRYGDLAKIMAAHKKAFDALEKFRKWYYIIGNHEDERFDEIEAAMPRNCAVRRHFTADGILVTHGHDFDPVNSGVMGWVGRAATWLASMLGELHPAAEDWLAATASRIRKSGRYVDEFWFERSVESYVARFEGISTIVCGHTHHRTAKRLAGGKLYINCGQWQRDGWQMFKDGEYVGRFGP